MTTKEKTKKPPRIWVPYGNVTKIAKALECSNQMVNGALAGRKTSDLAKKIRYVAQKEYGGQIIQSA